VAVCEAQDARRAEKSALTRRIAVTLKAAKSVSCDGHAPGAVDAAPGVAYRFESSAIRYRSIDRPVG